MREKFRNRMQGLPGVRPKRVTGFSSHRGRMTCIYRRHMIYRRTLFHSSPCSIQCVSNSDCFQPESGNLFTSISIKRRWFQLGSGQLEFQDLPAYHLLPWRHSLARSPTS